MQMRQTLYKTPCQYFCFALTHGGIVDVVVQIGIIKRHDHLYVKGCLSPSQQWHQARMANGTHNLYIPDLVCCRLCPRPWRMLFFDGNYTTITPCLCVVNSRIVHDTIRSCTQVTNDLKSRNGGFLLALNRNGLFPVNSSPCTLKSWHSWAAIGWHSCAFNFFVAQCLSPLSPRSSPGVISLTTPFCRLYDLPNCAPPLLGCPPGLRHPLLLQPVFQGIHLF